MTKRDLRMLNHALHMAEMSDAIPYKVGCVVAQKNKIINASFNSSKTHPMQNILTKRDSMQIIHLIVYTQKFMRLLLL